MEGNPVIILIPLFVIAGFGYALTRAFDLSEDTLVRALTDCFMPLLVFYSLYTSNLAVGETLSIAGASSFSVVFLALLCWVYCKLTGQRYAEFSLPVIFVNSGFLGIPLMELWKGFAAVNMIVVFDQIQNFWIFTFGIAVVAGGVKSSGLKEIIKSPLLWAIAAGFTVSYLDIKLPGPVEEVARFGGTGASTLAAFLLGCSVAERRIKVGIHVIAGTLIKYVGGFIGGLIACRIFGFQGSTRQVVIVASALPSAVFTFVLPLRYGITSELPGSMVIFSTLAGVVLIPALLYLAGVV